MKEELKKVTSKHSISPEHFFIRSRQRIAPASVCCHSEQGRILGWVNWSCHRQRAKARAATFRNENAKRPRVKNKLCRRTIKEMTAVNFGRSRSRFKSVFSRERRNCFHQSGSRDKLRKNWQAYSARTRVSLLNLAIFCKVML